MAQGFLLQVLLAVVGVDDVAVGVLRHGIDRQVATLQVCFQRDIRRTVHFETGIAMPVFTFGACQGVFFFGLRVQEHGKVAPDLRKALVQHLLGCGAYHHPVAIGDGSAQQSVADGAANKIDVHGRSVLRGCGRVMLGGAPSGRAGVLPSGTRSG